MWKESLVRKMAKEIITARIDPEDNVAISNLVKSGVFSNLSEAMQAAVKLLLTYCNMGEDLADISTASQEFRKRASIAAMESASRSMIISVVNELSTLIGDGQQRPVVDALTRIEKVAGKLPKKIQEQFYKDLSKEPVVVLAKKMVSK
jgi:Arc/MetJ-type ribon-helix-helix transcriptional regulator